MLASSYPPRQGGVGPLFELGVGGKTVPHYERCVILVPKLWTALKQEVYDEELDAGIHTCREENQEQKCKGWKKWFSPKHSQHVCAKLAHDLTV